jgi:hypothetical protein
VGNLPAPRHEWAITKLVSQQLGSIVKNQRDILIQVKNAFLASGWWTVVRSCDGTSISATDLWSDWSKIVNGGGFVSWITLRRSLDGVQLTIYPNVVGGWLEIAWYASPAAGFTGGNTSGTRPTATDEITCAPPAGNDWIGTDVYGPTDPNPQFRAFVWVSDDGGMTRVAWWYKGGLIAWWQFDKVYNQAGGDGSWVPFTTYAWDGGNSFGAPSTRMRLAVYDANGLHAARTPAGVNESIGLALEKWGGTYVVDQFAQNEQTLQYLWIPGPGLGNNTGASPRKGIIGYMEDLWFVGSTGGGATPVFADGDTANDGTFMFAGAMMLPWDGTTAPPTGQITASTDRPTASFYGRGDGDCNCGPDTCDEQTTTLITMRNGAKDLADKVDDDSVSDVTWNLWINQGIEDLWKRIVQATGDAFLSTYDFTLVGGAGGNYFDVTTIPARDFRRLRMLELNPDTSNRRRIKPFNLAEKDNGPTGVLMRIWDPDRRYRRMGNKIYVERFEVAAGTYRLYYEPKTTALEMTCDALPDVLDEWAEYPQVFAAMKALGKEESDPGFLPTRLGEMRADIAALKGEPDDDADASVIADVEDDGGNEGWWR